MSDSGKFSQSIFGGKYTKQGMGLIKLVAGLHSINKVFVKYFIAFAVVL
jgi:hypothetical protein